MSNHLTGQQARELLDGSRLAISGNWYDKGDAEEMLDPLAYHDVSGDAHLIAASPALAETVAWLYGREPDLVEKDGRAEWDMTAHHEVVAVDGEVLDMDGRSHTPEDAVEYARALLAAAEAAKQG